MIEPRFATDSAGRYRRLCDKPIAFLEWSRKPGPCEKYAALILESGEGRCSIHREDRKGSWVMCSQPVAWDPDAAVSTVTRTCGHRGRFVYEAKWYCKQHDPFRPRCENKSAHPWRLPVLGVIPIGALIDPRAPRMARKLFGVRLCVDCAKPGQLRLEDAQPSREPRVPCCLCSGTCALEDDAGRPFPCVCTPGGRELVNGAPDAVVLRGLRDAGFLEA